MICSLAYALKLILKRRLIFPLQLLFHQDHTSKMKSFLLALCFLVVAMCQMVVPILGESVNASGKPIDERDLGDWGWGWSSKSTKTSKSTDHPTLFPTMYPTLVSSFRMTCTIV
jgi:hypothetical protein